MMRDLLAQIIRNIVEFPDQVKVEPVNTERALVLSVSVAPEDVGKVIGREGRIINALRTVVRSAPLPRGSRQRVTVEINAPPPPGSDAPTGEAPAPPEAPAE
ncbi:MAG: KH domain-containing protein [bacterium]|nr:KH domain-containing protein [bacterium]